MSWSEAIVNTPHKVVSCPSALPVLSHEVEGGNQMTVESGFLVSDQRVMTVDSDHTMVVRDGEHEDLTI